MGEPGPKKLLPTDASWANEDEYVSALLSFATNCDIFHNLCGGIHILDFLTREPDLYNTVLPHEWRAWFETATTEKVLDLLLRENLEKHLAGAVSSCEGSQHKSGEVSFPPLSLIEYVRKVRSLCLLRDFVKGTARASTLPRKIAMGMKPKKIHEVHNFAAYIDNLSRDLTKEKSSPGLQIVDFGSGQNYLGRTLACEPYDKHVIAIERFHHNIAGAKGMDVHANIAAKRKIMRNKKEYKQQLAEQSVSSNHLPNRSHPQQANSDMPDSPGCQDAGPGYQYIGKGSMTYIEYEINDGHLEHILRPSEARQNTLSSSSSPEETQDESSDESLHVAKPSDCQAENIVISLHSCGNLVHHGLRSLALNPSVRAVAMIGCCYNLMTERLGPATYKLPTLRPNHPRLEATSSAFDPHGFPMSRALENYEHKHGKGVRLNITARMMAVQAPSNWGPVDSEAFFRRHFYRALLQRILLDRGVVKQCSDPDSIVGGSISGKDTAGTPLVVGSLRKSCFMNFRAYVHGALEKLCSDPNGGGEAIKERTSDITNEVIDKYEAEWGYAKKNLSIIWSLMAFSAGVVESVIAVDRWLYLRELDCVEKCWVEPVFDYEQSPRNLVVVGIKKR